MALNIEINKQEFEVNNTVIQSAIQKSLQKLQESGKVLPGQSIQISVAIVSRDEIKQLNKEWRGNDEETDVLSFNYEHSSEKLEGEIVLCIDVIKDNAMVDRVDFDDELIKNIAHSVLHIVGYEHGEEMFKIQEEIIGV
jgi:probable rRNA maturation factor